MQRSMHTQGPTWDIVCLAHLNWEPVKQRPHHLMQQAARGRRVLYVEEPEYGGAGVSIERREVYPNITVITPTIPDKLPSVESDRLHARVIEQEIRDLGFDDYVLWFYSPMPVTVTGCLSPVATIYDCMDELAAFEGAPRTIRQREAEVLRQADLVFTGGMSLYESKRHTHPHVHAIPSSVDVMHFHQARTTQLDRLDQATIPHPRLGFFGVIDERIDLSLIAEIADRRPEWQVVMVGPVAKIEPSALPRRANIHYLGAKRYEELPAYVAGWDVALMPFAINNATRYISPTKTPEYLAAGRPVVSTSIADVVRPYGDLALVAIGGTHAEFIDEIERLMTELEPGWLERVDHHLEGMSWSATWSRMETLIESAIRGQLSESRHMAAAG